MSLTNPTPDDDDDGGDGGRPQLVSIAEIALMLGVDVRHVRRLVFEQRIPYFKWGHLIRFDPKEVIDWLQQHHQRPRRGA